MRYFLTMLMFQSIFSRSGSLMWKVKHPDSVRAGTEATLQWKVTLTPEETAKANSFSLILLEREMFLFSNLWQLMAVKQYSSGVFEEVGDSDSFDIIPGNDLILNLLNVTDRDATRYRCTFFSSFAAPKSIIQVDLKDSPLFVSLVGGTAPNNGRVEVYRNGFWGTICSNNWDIPDASVVCRMLGYTGAWTAPCCAKFGEGLGPIWLSDLSCTGEEGSLSDCRHSGWANNTCDHAHDAGVICHSLPTEKPLRLPGTTTKTIQPTSTSRGLISLSTAFLFAVTSTPMLDKTPVVSRSFTVDLPSLVVSTSSVVGVPTSSASTTPPDPIVRLEGGDNNLGRVEIYQNGTWGTVCDDHWDIKDAAVVCRMLGFAYAWTAISFGVLVTEDESDEYGTGPIWLDNVNCTGNESSLADCSHNGWHVHNCVHLEDAGVWCNDSQRPADQPESTVVDDVNKPTGPAFVQVRLVNGSNIQEGRVEILYNGTWGTVCDDDFDIRSADVICRMAGFPGAVSAEVEARFGEGSPNSPILLDDLWCSGHESTIASCSFLGWGSSDCDHDEDAGVVCLPVVFIELLDGNDFPNQGRVSLFYDGLYGTICDDEWDIDDANVVCRMLGYPMALAATTDSYFGEGSGPIWLDEVDCVGDERTIAACPHNGWGSSDCNHTEDAGVICAFNYTVKPREASCDFDIWYCGWENGPGSFTWTRHLGYTPSRSTGPSGDHTSGAGFYFYIEGSGRNPGEMAYLVSPQIVGDGSPTCLVFYYHLKVSALSSLRVKVSDQVLWEITGHQGDDWYRATVPLSYNATYQVSFEGVVGATSFSDVAIDDVQFLENTSCAVTAETLVASKVVWISANQTVEVGSSATFRCVVLGSPTPLIVWRKDGKVLVSSSVTGNFTLANISLGDVGLYECSAENPVANDSTTTQLNVVERPKGTTVKSNVYYDVAFLNDNVTLECSSSGYPKPVCQFLRQGNLLNPNGSDYVLRNFTAADEGEYICNCSNVIGSEIASVTLVLYVPPAIDVTRPANQSFNETDTIRVYCNATGKPPPTITWSKVGESSKVFPPGSWLTIQRASKFDFGQYKCTATCIRGDSVSALATVNLNNFSPAINHNPGNVTILEMDRKNVTLVCNATGKPAPTISWTRVTDGSIVASQASLLIVAANRSHRGEYRCLALNGVGDPVSRSAFIDVQYAPSSTRLKTDKVNSVVQGNGRITLTCTTDANPQPSRYQFYHESSYLRTSLAGVHVIPKARHSDKGVYKCVPINVLGTGTNATVSVYVNGPLSIIYPPRNKTVNESANVQFFCNATSYPPFDSFAPQISWKKLGDSSKVLPNGRLLFLQNVDRHDAGTYVCEANNGVGYPDTANAVLNVLHKPYDTILETSIPDNVAVINTSVVIRCKATANPLVELYKIYHNNTLVSNTSTGIYNISRVLKEHSGLYVCVPYNSFGLGLNASRNVTFVGACGVKRVHVSWAPQIVGGVQAKPGEWPWQVQLGYSDSPERSRHLCAGAILHHYWIVTAAHCIKTDRGERNHTNFNVTVGELHLAVNEGTEQSIPVDKIILHENYSHQNVENDIALMKLQQPIVFNIYVSPICLPTSDFNTGDTCYVTGWGLLSRHGRTSDTLQETTVPLMNHTKCKNLYQNVRLVTPHMRCAGALGQSQGTCLGDSGGPLACERDGRWYLLGITSWGKEGCMDEGDPGVFSDVWYFRNWIEEVMNDNSPAD